MATSNDAKVVVSPSRMQLLQFEKDLEFLQKIKNQKRLQTSQNIIIICK